VKSKVRVHESLRSAKGMVGFARVNQSLGPRSIRLWYVTECLRINLQFHRQAACLSIIIKYLGGSAMVGNVIVESANFGRERHVMFHGTLESLTFIDFFPLSLDNVSEKIMVRIWV
jgi:hypothetical protein